LLWGASKTSQFTTWRVFLEPTIRLTQGRGKTQKASCQWLWPKCRNIWTKNHNFFLLISYTEVEFSWVFHFFTSSNFLIANKKRWAAKNWLQFGLPVDFFYSKKPSMGGCCSLVPCGLVKDSQGNLSMLWAATCRVRFWSIVVVPVQILQMIRYTGWFFSCRWYWWSG
jgi:hypothetical protein